MSESRNKVDYDYSSKFDIIFSGLAVLVLAVGLVTWYTHKTNHESMQSLSAKYIGTINSTVIEKTTAFMSAPELTAQHGSFFTPESILSLTDNKHLEKSMLAVLMNNPDLKSFYVGNMQGDFLMQSRTSKSSFRTEIVSAQNEKPVVTYKDYSTFTKEWKISRGSSDFDPRVRPWYVGASDVKGKFWSDIYVFHSSQKPGITASFPVLDDDGNIIGVFGLDITLQELADFLFNMNVGTRRLSFIMKDDGNIVAFPDATAGMIEGKDGTLKIRNALELDNKVLVSSYKHYASTGESQFVFNADGTNYIASYIGFPDSSSSSGWINVLVVPEDEIIGGVKSTSSVLFYASMFILLMVIVFSGLLIQIKRALGLQTALIRGSFGRYLSDDIVNQILEAPQGMELGGEKREVTIMMTDLRGFTSLTEKYPAEDVVSVLNMYFEVMTEVIMRHNGTIDEFIGDAIMVIFGAPKTQGIDAQRAVACALDMLNAMDEVNERCVKLNYPTLMMGIGLNTDHVVVGNIGSSKRIKYGVVGRGVNLAARIESYTTSNQLLISEQTLKSCGQEHLSLRDKFEASVKGIKEPIKIYDVDGITGYYDIKLNIHDEVIDEYEAHILAQFSVMEGKHVTDQVVQARITGYSENTISVIPESSVDRFTVIKFTNLRHFGDKCDMDVYCKVIKKDYPEEGSYVFYLTDIPDEARQFLADAYMTDDEDDEKDQ